MDFLKENKPLSEAENIISMLQRAVSSGDDCRELVSHGLFIIKALILEAAINEG